MDGVLGGWLPLLLLLLVMIGGSQGQWVGRVLVLQAWWFVLAMALWSCSVSPQFALRRGRAEILFLFYMCAIHSSNGNPLEATCPNYWSSRDNQSRVPRATIGWLCKISKKKTPWPLGNLCQCSVTNKGKKRLLMFTCTGLCPLLLVLTLGTTEKSLTPLCTFPPGLCRLIKLPEFSCLYAKQFQIFLM